MSPLSRRAAIGHAAVILCAAVLAASRGGSADAAPRQAEQDRTRGRDLVLTR